MGTFLKVLLCLLAGAGSVQVYAQAITGQEKYDITCGVQYECFSDEALKQMLTGKMVKYKHPRGAEFGVVVLALNKDGTAQVSNTKGSAGFSTWGTKDGKLLLSTREWKDFSFHIVRVGGLTMFAPFTGSGLTVLVPFSVE